MGDPVGEPGQLVGVGVEEGAADDAVAFGAGGGAQCFDAGVHGAQRGGHGVGEVEEAASAAAVLAEGVAGCGRAVGVGEVVGEVVEVGDGGAAPAVDGLAGVADGGDGVAGAVAEESGEQDALGDGGVLVLVEEDDPELLAEQGADCRVAVGEGGGEGDLVAEVDEVAVAFGAAVLLDEPGEVVAGAGDLGEFAQVGVGERGALQGAEQIFVVVAQPVGGDEVFGELAVEGEQVADEVGEGAGERGVGSGRLPQHPGGELEAGGVGEQAGAGFQSEPESVIGEEPSGEGVVGGDDRFAGGVLVLVAPGGASGSGSVTAGFGQCLADAFGEFARGLVGEGQPEDLFGRDLPGADEPDDAGRHHRGLARSRLPRRSPGERAAR